MDRTLSFFETPSSPGQKGARAWLLTTDHKRIGLMYLWVVLFWFFLGACLGLLLRTQLMSVNHLLLSAQTYNAAFTLHGVIMIFLFVIPAIPAILGNFLVPLQFPMLIFAIFTSFVQALVFSMLVTIYITVAISGHEEHH